MYNKVQFLFSPSPYLAQFGLFRPRDALNNPGTGSSSSADAKSFSKNVDIGKHLGVSTSGARSQSLTNNGGSQSFAQSGSLSNAVNLAGLPISSTINRDKTYSTNGGLSGNLGHNLQIGNFGLNTQLGPGGIKVNYGPQQAGQQTAGSNANAGSFATGDGAQTSSNSGSKTQSQNFGAIGVTSSQSFADSKATSQNGQTGAFANGASTASNQGGGQQNQLLAQGQGRQPGIGGGFLGPNPGLGGGSILGGLIGGALSAAANRQPGYLGQQTQPGFNGPHGQIPQYGGGFGGNIGGFGGNEVSAARYKREADPQLHSDYLNTQERHHRHHRQHHHHRHPPPPFGHHGIPPHHHPYNPHHHHHHNHHHQHNNHHSHNENGDTDSKSDDYPNNTQNENEGGFGGPPNYHHRPQHGGPPPFNNNQFPGGHHHHGGYNPHNQGQGGFNNNGHGHGGYNPNQGGFPNNGQGQGGYNPNNQGQGQGGNNPNNQGQGGSNGGFVPVNEGQVFNQQGGTKIPMPPPIGGSITDNVDADIDAIFSKPGLFKTPKL